MLPSGGRVVVAVVYEVAYMGLLVLGLRVYGPYLTPPPLQTQGGGEGFEALSLSK